MSRLSEQRIEETGYAPAQVRRPDQTGPAFLQAGNQAVANLLAQRLETPPQTAPKLPGKAGEFQEFINGGGPYVLTMYVLNDDIVGHAWVGVRRGDGQNKTIGFWPKGVTGGLISGGVEYSPDPHTGEQSAAHDVAIPDIAQMNKILPVIQDWDGAIYMMIFKNCTHFVVDVWNAVTGTDVMPGKNGDLRVDWWNPIMLRQAVDERNRKKQEFDAARGK